MSLSRSCRRKHQRAATGRRWRSLATNTVSSIADAFKARLEALEMQSAETDRRIAEHIARCHQLINEQQAAEAQWAAAHPELL